MGLELTGPFSTLSSENMTQELLDFILYETREGYVHLVEGITTLPILKHATFGKDSGNPPNSSCRASTPGEIGYVNMSPFVLVGGIAFSALNPLDDRCVSLPSYSSTCALESEMSHGSGA